MRERAKWILLTFNISFSVCMKIIPYNLLHGPAYISSECIERCSHSHSEPCHIKVGNVTIPISIQTRPLVSTVEDLLYS